jgi:hypothetical protein
VFPGDGEPVEEDVMARFIDEAQRKHYEVRYCQRCVHYGGWGKPCPVLELHVLWNYDASGEPDAPQGEKIKHQALNTLWPRTGGYNGRCAMFHKKP